MDTGFAQVLSSVLGGSVSIVVAIIAGYYTIRAAQVKANEKGTSQSISSPKKSWLILILYAVIVSVLSVPLGFAFAYTGNSLAGAYPGELFVISLDPAFVSGILSFVGYLLGAWSKRLDIGIGSLAVLFIIVGVFSAPVGYSIAYVGNWLSGTLDYLLVQDSLDSLFVGGIMCSVGFAIGVLTNSFPQNAAA